MIWLERLGWRSPYSNDHDDRTRRPPSNGQPRLPLIREVRATRPRDARRPTRTNQQNQRNVHFSAQALEALEEQSWPGNIRELDNVVERTVLLTDQSTVSRQEIEAWLPDLVKAPPATRGEQPPRPVPLPGQTPLVREYLPSAVRQ